MILPERIEYIHDLLAAAYGSYRQTAANDLRKSSDIRCHAIHFLGATCGKSKRLYFIKNKKHIILSCKFSKPIQIFLFCRNHTAGSKKRLQDHSCNFIMMFLQNLFHCFQIIVGNNVHFLCNLFTDSTDVRSWNQHLFRMFIIDHRGNIIFHHICCPMITTQNLNNPRLSGINLCSSCGKQRSLCTRVTKTDSFDSRNSAAKQLGKLYLILYPGWHCRSFSGCITDGICNHIIGMSMEQRGIIIHTVNVRISVSIPYQTAFSAYDSKRIGRIIGYRPCLPSCQI